MDGWMAGCGLDEWLDGCKNNLYISGANLRFNNFPPQRQQPTLRAPRIPEYMPHHFVAYALSKSDGAHIVCIYLSVRWIQHIFAYYTKYIYTYICLWKMYRTSTQAQQILALHIKHICMYVFIYLELAWPTYVNIIYEHIFIQFARFLVSFWFRITPNNNQIKKKYVCVLFSACACQCIVQASWAYLHLPAEFFRCCCVRLLLLWAIARVDQYYTVLRYICYVYS